MLPVKNTNYRKGHITSEAIYFLREGLIAQEKFYEIRIKGYAAIYSLYFSEVNLDNLPTCHINMPGSGRWDKKDRKWMSQPEGGGNTEYISISIPSLPTCAG